MKLEFKVLGFTLSSIELTLPTAAEAPPIPRPIKDVIEKGVDGMSSWWVKRMMKKR